MTYIALVPQTRLFDSEHMTLCWLGRQINHQQVESARRLVGMMNDACRLWREELDDEDETSDASQGLFAEVLPQTAGPYRLFTGGVVVACCTVSDELQQFYDIAEIVGLNASEHKASWQPHITGMQVDRKNHWRKPGEFVRFSYAELRNIPEQLKTDKEREKP